MTNSLVLSAVRKRHFGLGTLPDTIMVPALGSGREPVVKALDEATLDDIALALCGIESEFNEVGDRMHALRRLYNLGRTAGALGAERIVEALEAAGRER